jgi:methionyl-tRNA formyltransferase
VTVCKKLSRDDGKIDWSKTTEEIYNLYRGTTPWPGIWTILGDTRVKLIEIKPAQFSIEPGLIHTSEDKIYVGTKNGSIEITKIQFEGKQMMNVNACLAGNWLTLDKQKFS